MISSKPLISICMPTRNVVEYLPDCIRSIQAQTYKNWELIIVNDGSTDSTADLLDYYQRQDSRIGVFHLPHRGIAASRNQAGAIANGDYIAVMDSDDVMYKSRLTIALATLAKKKADVFYSAYYRMNEAGKIQDGIIPPQEFSYQKTKVEDILATQLIPHVTIIAKRQCFIDHPYNEKHRVNDDLGLVLSFWKANYRFCMSKHPLVAVRYHEKSTSATKDKEVKKVTAELRKLYA